MATRSTTVGLVEVARLAGVSPSTVSGVFRDTGATYSVSPATRDRVMQAAAKLGYRPNSLARAMRRRRFQQVGFLVQQPHRTFYVMPESLSGVFDAVTAASHHLVFIGMPPEFTRDSHALPQSFQDECIDCLVSDNTLGFTRDIAQVLQGSRFPVVHLNSHQPANAVYVDDAAAAREATEYMLRLGRRRIAFFNYRRAFSDTHYSFRIRRETYFQVMAEAGLPSREIAIPYTDTWAADTEPFLRGKNRPDALVCYQDTDAVSVQIATASLGLKVPDDIALIGFNGATAAAFSPTPLPTMQIPWYELGRTATEMALQLAENKNISEMPSKVFRAKLVTSLFGNNTVL